MGPASPRDYGKMEVDVSEVLAAIGTLYDAQVHDKQKHDQASRWLGQLQRSVSSGERVMCRVCMCMCAWGLVCVCTYFVLVRQVKGLGVTGSRVMYEGNGLFVCLCVFVCVYICFCCVIVLVKPGTVLGVDRVVLGCTLYIL